MLEEATPSKEQADIGIKRIIKRVKVFEVSPVLLGAGVDTATLAVKALSSLDAGAVAEFLEGHKDEIIKAVAERTTTGANAVTLDVTPEEKALSTARRPTFNGTEDSAWSKPTLADYIAGLNLPDAQWGDLTAAQKGRIVTHTLLGQASAPTFDEANAFPVVNPRSGKLNGGAVRNAAARASQAGLSAATVDSVKNMCANLLDEYFKSADPGETHEPDEAEMKETLAREFGRAELMMAKIPGKA